MLKTEGYENSELFMALTPKNGAKAAKLYSYKPIDGTGDFHWSRSHTAYRLNQSGVLELMGNNVPRVDYTNTCPELLMEKASTNIVLQSQTFDNATWVKASSGTGINPVVTANTTLAPDGTTTADTIVFNSGAGTTTSDISSITQTISGVAGSTFSIWLKGAVGGEVILLRINNLLGAYEQFTLTTEWQRFEYFESSTPNSLELGIRQGVPSTINSTATVYAWGAQLEESEYATSYIPTTTTTQTRPKDICYNTTNTFGDAAWSIVMRVRLNNIGSSTSEPLIALNDGSTDNYFCIYTDANPKLYFDWYNNPDQDTLDTTDLSNGIVNVGVSFDSVTAEYIIVIDGTLFDSGTLVVNPPGLFGNFNRLDLGTIAGTGNLDGDGIIGVQYYDSALTQTDLENLTTA